MRNVIRKVIPDKLLSTWRRIRDAWNTSKDLLLLCRICLAGGSYTDFYAARMDKLAESVGETVTGRPEDKLFQLEYLEKHGLTPDAEFLDYGCGAVAAGVHFIKYLESGRYTGADISGRCIELAESRIQKLSLQGKEARLVHLPGGDLAKLNGRRFDIIWAQSVFTHMPADAIRGFLIAVRRFLKPSGRFFANFASAEGKRRRTSVKDFYYKSDLFLQAAKVTGYDCEIMSDWRHPAGAFDRLLCFSLSKKGSHHDNS